MNWSCNWSLICVIYLVLCDLKTNCVKLYLALAFNEAVGEAEYKRHGGGGENKKWSGRFV